MPIPKIGDLVAHKYRIQGSLGEGGMAVVLLAHHELLDRQVAVKILDPNAVEPAAFKGWIDRFLGEARAAARVDSHHVARIMDVGTLEDGLPFMVMERLEGSDLEQLLALEKKLPIEDAIDFTLQALAGLAHAHALGIVHRDLKPANLFLAKQSDGRSIIKILDFGIAKRVDQAGKGLTQTGTAVGTPMYMAPEQIRTPESVDTRADIWAMGVVLYELISGKRPFDGEGVQIFASILENDVELLRTHRREVTETLDLAILKCLERDPKKRYQDVGELAKAIAPFGSGQWHALVDHIDATLHGHANISTQLTPTGIPVRKEKSPSTETNIETPSRPMPAVRRSSGLRVLLLTAACAAAIVLGMRQHAFDGILSRAIPPPSPPASSTPEATSVPSASASASAKQPAASTTKPATAKSTKPTATVSVPKKPPTPPKPTSTKKH